MLCWIPAFECMRKHSRYNRQETFYAYKHTNPHTHTQIKWIIPRPYFYGSLFYWKCILMHTKRFLIFFIYVVDYVRSLSMNAHSRNGTHTIQNTNSKVLHLQAFFSPFFFTLNRNTKNRFQTTTKNSLCIVRDDGKRKHARLHSHWLDIIQNSPIGDTLHTQTDRENEREREKDTGTHIKTLCFMTFYAIRTNVDHAMQMGFKPCITAIFSWMIAASFAVAAIHFIYSTACSIILCENIVHRNIV